jgi:uncharacterized protein (DUF4415 family)
MLLTGQREEVTKMIKGNTRAAHKEGCTCQACKNKRGDIKAKQIKAIRIDIDLYDACRAAAETNGEKITHILEGAMRAYLAGQGK